MHLTCAWCKKELSADAEVIALSAKIKDDYFKQAESQEGQIVQFHLYSTNQDIPAVIPTVDSEAKRAGKDLMFPTCSMGCGKALDAVLQEEKGIVETLL